MRKSYQSLAYSHCLLKDVEGFTGYDIPKYEDGCDLSRDT